MLDALRLDSGPPLFYVAEKPLVLVAEIARRDVLARLLPFVTVLLLFGAAVALPTRRTRGWFIVLCATSPLLLVYSGEARAYGPLAFLGLVLFLMLFRGEPTAKRFAAASALAALALWTHYLALFFVGSCAATALLRRRWQAAGACGVGFLAFLPWISILRKQPAQSTQWMWEPVARVSASMLSGLGGAPRLPAPLGPAQPPLVAACGLAAALLLAIAVLRESKKDPETLAAGLTAAIYLLATIGASLIRPVAFAGRTEMAIVGLVLWVLARSAGRGGIASIAALAVLGVGTASSALLLAFVPAPSAAATAPKALGRVIGPTPVFAAAGFYLPMRLAADRGELRDRVLGIPASLERHPGWFVPAPLTPRQCAEVADRLHDQVGERAVLLLPPALASSELLQAIGRQGNFTVARPGEQVLLVFWVRHRAAGGAAPESSAPGNDPDSLNHGALRAIASRERP